MADSAFAHRIAGAHGTAGVAWLERLPRLLVAVRRDWGLRPDGAYELSYAYVEPVRRADGAPAVLKLTLPGDAEAGREAAALACFAGEAAAAMLEHDPERGALLLERLEPGTRLAELAAHDDDAATLAAAEVMRGLRRPPPVEPVFPDARTWGRALWAWPEPLARRARDEYAELCASADAPVLVHGDLHHFNVLRSGGGWKAIDPKGVVAEPAYETGALLRNPVGTRLERRTLARRIALLADALALDRERIRAWGRTQAALAAAWSAQDGQDPAFFLACAELLTRC
jgi:streptomycin 6-kinase